MMRTRAARPAPLLLALLAALLLAVAAGCGDDGGDEGNNAQPPAASPSAAAPPTSPPAPAATGPQSAREYLMQANEYCAEYETGRAAIPDDAGAEEQFERGIPLAEQYVAQFRTLRPPPELAQAHADYLASQEGIVALLKELRAGLEAGEDDEQLVAGAGPRLQALAQQGAAAQRALGLTCQR